MIFETHSDCHPNLYIEFFKNCEVELRLVVSHVYSEDLELLALALKNKNLKMWQALRPCPPPRQFPPSLSALEAWLLPTPHFSVEGFAGG